MSAVPVAVGRAQHNSKLVQLCFNLGCMPASSRLSAMVFLEALDWFCYRYDKHTAITYCSAVAVGLLGNAVFVVYVQAAGGQP
jgi:hypothetical protein